LNVSLLLDLPLTMNVGLAFEKIFRAAGFRLKPKPAAVAHAVVCGGNLIRDPYTATRCNTL